jgi:hypothetical protein
MSPMTMSPVGTMHGVYDVYDERSSRAGALEAGGRLRTGDARLPALPRAHVFMCGPAVVVVDSILVVVF